MGFFDEISDTFKAVEKLDALIVRVEKFFSDALTDDHKKSPSTA